MKEVFKPTTGKVAVILFLFLIWIMFFGIKIVCPLTARICPVDQNTPGAIERSPGNYYVPAKSLPFLLSCNQTCGEEEYKTELKKAWTNFIIFKALIPLIVIYIGFCLANELIRKSKTQ